VKRTPRPPAIDGKIKDGEWRFATTTAGFLNLTGGNFADEKTTVHVTTDGAE
jgi:hypothetical protein